MRANLKIVGKALDGQQYPLPLCEYMWMCDGERGSSPEGADDLCFFGKCHYERYGFRGRDMDLEARILALSWSKGRIGTGAGGFELGFWSKSWVWALRLGFGPHG